MIKVHNLSKHFGKFIAVDNLNFEVAKGEVLGFLGPNGAGKSTSMKMLTCFLPPTSGTAKICGLDIIKDSLEVRKMIGYLAENSPLYEEMVVRDFLRFIGSLRGLARIKDAIDRVVAACKIESVFYQTIATLSKGYRRRVGLAQALLHDPEVLILDEPTDGLDPNQKFEVRNLINAMSKSKCIVLSTHILEEVDAVCSRAIIIANGKLKANGSPHELRKLAPDYHALLITCALPQEVQKGETPNIEKLLAEIGDVLSTDRLSETQVLVIPKPGKSIQEAVRDLLNKNQITLHSIETTDGSLASSFRFLTKGTV